MIGSITQPDQDKQLKSLTEQMAVLQVSVHENAQQLNQPPNNGRQQRQDYQTQRNPSNQDQMKTCSYCDSLAQNTNRTASEIASIITSITKKDFNITHTQFQVRHSGRWIIPPHGCLQWLHASMDDRIKSLGSKPSVCTVCLAAPSKWNAAKTTCESTHSISRRRQKPRQ